MTPPSIESDMSPPAVVVISHGEDADGITCAALLKRMKSARPILVNYNDLKDAIRGIQPPLEELYMCDLNIREDLVEEILRITGFTRVTIIDGAVVYDRDRDGPPWSAP